MNNLFAIFEPAAFLGMPLNWVSRIVVLSLCLPLFWKRRRTILVGVREVVNRVNTELKALASGKVSSVSTFLPICLFITILFNNFWGLFPYIFTSSRHLTFTVALALPLWLGHMVYRWVYSTEDVLAHLVPLGTPGALIPFMVLIEIVRSVIRPLTLSVRLAANMVAGHLLLNLLGSQGPSASSAILGLLIGALICLCILELGVSFIQAYVFRVLIALYLNEINGLKLARKLSLANKLRKLKTFKVLNSIVV